MSDPEVNSRINIEFETAKPALAPREFTGALLVPKEDWKVACDHDEHLQKILDYIDQDRATRFEIKKELSRLYVQVRELKGKLTSLHNREAARKRQYKHFAKLLRRRMAWEKIEKMRKEAGLST